jgi:hypothetical protein
LALGFRFGFLQRIEVQEALVFFEDFSSSSGYVVLWIFVGMGILGSLGKGIIMVCGMNLLSWKGAFLAFLLVSFPLIFLLLLVSSVFFSCLGELGNISQRNEIWWLMT